MYFNTRIIGLFFALCLTTALSAQLEWTKVLPSIPHEDLKDIYVDETGFGWAVGENGTILKTINKGEEWTAIPTELTDDLSRVEYIPGSNGQSVLVSTNRGIIYRSDNGGSIWTTVEWETIETVIDEVFVLSENNFFLTTRDSRLYRSTDQGATWTELTDNFPANSDKFSFLDAQKAWLMDASGLVHYTVDGGDTWQQTEPTAFSQGTVIRFLDESVGFLSSGRDLYKSEDGGASFSLHTEGAFSSSLRDMVVIDEDRLVGIGGSRIFQSQDGGLTWEFINNFTSTGNLERLHTHADGSVWSVAQYMGIPHTREFSENWIDQYPGDKSPLRSIDIDDSGSGVIAGAISAFYTTEDFGATWEYKPQEGANYLYAGMASETVAWGTFFAYINKSTDGGETWERMINLPGSLVLNIEIISEDEVWAPSSRGFLVHTTDGGASWEIDTLPGEPYMTDVHFINENIGIAAGRDGVIFRTSNGGESWNQIDASTNFSFGKITFLDENTGWLVVDSRSSEILKTEDAGLTWTIEQLPTGSIWRDLKMVSPEVGFLVGGTASGGVVCMTEDGGQTWVVERNDEIPFNAVEGTTNPENGDITVWLIGSGGSVEFTTLTNSVNSTFTANAQPLQVFPNPGTGSFQVSWTADCSSMMTIYNQQGQLVKQLPLFRGKNNVEVNDLSDGLYFLSAQCKGLRYTAKWLKR